MAIRLPQKISEKLWSKYSGDQYVNLWRIQSKDSHPELWSMHKRSMEYAVEEESLSYIFWNWGLAGLWMENSYLYLDNSEVVDYFVAQITFTWPWTQCGYCSVTFNQPFLVHWRIRQVNVLMFGLIHYASNSVQRWKIILYQMKTRTRIPEERDCIESLLIPKWSSFWIYNLPPCIYKYAISNHRDWT